MRGVITKGISGFYYVRTEDALIECKARGVFRSMGLTPLAGDRVEISLGDDGKGVIEELLPRLNSFERPPVANVETVVLVTSAKKPLPSFLTIDKFTVAVEKSGAELIMCLNKTDLAPEGFTEEFSEIYAKVAPVYPVCAKTGMGVDELKAALTGKQAALAGPSGVGKSTLTNLLAGENSSQTGEISRKSLRGKNTTRHTELFEGDGFFLFDTPGFTSFDVLNVESTELSGLFTEFNDYVNQCRFDDCAHLGEPDCGIKKAVEEGFISRSRYESYAAIYKELKEKEKY